MLFAIFLIALAFLGSRSGIYPFFVLILLLLPLFRPYVSGNTSSSNGLFRIGLVIILGCSATLLPFPDFMVGKNRAGAFRRAAALRQAVSAIAEDPMAASTIASGRHEQLNGDEGGSHQHASPEPGDAIYQPPKHVWAYLTLNRAGTIRTVFLAAGFFSCFWFCAASDIKTRRRLLVFLIVLATACSVTGIVSRCLIPQGKTLLWIFPVKHGTPIGPFINRNHFAFFCALLIPPCLFFCIHKQPPYNRPTLALQTSKRFLKKVFFLFCGLILTGGVVVSLSRSGFLVMVTGVTVVVIYCAINRLWQAFTLLFLICLIGVGLFLLPFKAFQDRIGTLKNPLETNSAHIRLQVWKDAVSIWRKYPLLGAGADAFRVVYPTAKKSWARKGTIHAENEYVQILADNGLAGAGLVAIAVFIFCRSLAKERWGGEDMGGDAGLFKGVAWAVLSGCAVHACLDFGLRMPLNALTVACLLGCAYPPAYTGNENEGAFADEASLNKVFHRFRKWVVSLLILFALLTVFYGSSAWELDHYDFLKGKSTGIQTQAVAWAPTYWFPWYETGRRCLEMSAMDDKKGTVRQMTLAKFGKECVQIAASLNPSDYRVWIAVAKVTFQQGDFTAADQAARRVIQLRPYRKDQVEKFLKDP